MSYVYDDGRSEKGKQLAQELIRHGVKDREIAEILGVTSSCIYRWRQEVRRDGWQDTEIRVYDEPGELERKLQELHNYKGLFSAKDKQERIRKKMIEAEELFEQGLSIRQITKKMHVSYETVRRWRDVLGYNTEKNEPKIKGSAAWVSDWCRRWDDFMSQLERPIRLAGESD